MEFDIGTLIYIIITIVAIVAGVAGKKKKPGTGQPGAEDQKATGGFFGKLEEQFSGFIDEARGEFVTDNEQVEPAPDGQTEDTPVQAYDDAVAVDVDDEKHEDNSYYAQYEGVYDPDAQANLDLMAAEAIRTTDPDAIEVIDVEELPQADYFEIVKDFDLGTAVIYSTIINRKEY